VKLKHLIGIAGLTVFLASWIAVGVGFAIHVDKSTWVILVVVAAFATEALIWCIAAVLGLGILEARNRIWRWLRKPFTRMHR
jgi:hypothetical protein